MDAFFPLHERPGTPRGWSKSGAILPEKVGGVWWMYFGDTHVWAACSRDLETWEVLPQPVLSPRPGCFDSFLVEPGPPPVLLAADDRLKTLEGICLLYNGAREPEEWFVYSVGQILMDLLNPAKAMRRSVRPLLEPETVEEKDGHVENVVFAAGLVQS